MPKGGQLWHRVAIVEEPAGCWLWEGSNDREGYGRILVKGTVVLAHNLTWELYHGDIPAGQSVRHHCGNPPCVRPSHLFLGAPAERRAKRGFRPGKDHPRAKLTEADIEALRRRYTEGGVTYKSLGVAYGVNRVTVGKIVRGQAWKRLTTDGVTAWQE